MARRERVGEIMDQLAAAGGRRTASRWAIVEAMLGARGHVTAEQLADRVQRGLPSVNLSTVYRTLEALEDLGVIDHVHLGHGRAVYHRRDESHHHLYCEDCEHVEELPVAQLAPLLRLLDREYGFELDRRHFAMVGRCRTCRGRMR